MRITIAEANVSDVINASGILQFTTRGPEAYVNYATSYVCTDYVYITITYTPSLTAPTLVSPTNGGTGYTITPNFDWNVSTGGTSPYTYELMVDTDLAFGSPDINATGISDSNYSYTAGLTPATTYYWKVRTKDAGGAYSSWTSTQSFTTASFVAPTFVVPTAGSSVTTTTPTLSWGASTGGDGNYTYEVQLSLNSGFTTTVLDVTGITTTSYTLTSNLTPDTHYARIRAKDGLGNYTSWASTVSFTAVASSSGGSSSSSSSTQEEYVPLTLPTTNNDTPAVTAPATSGTSIFTKYIVQPVQTVIINPMGNFFSWVWASFKALVYGSNREQIDVPVVGYVDSGLILLLGIGVIVMAFLFGSPVKKKDVRKLNKQIGKNVKKIKRVI